MVGGGLQDRRHVGRRGRRGRDLRDRSGRTERADEALESGCLRDEQEASSSELTMKVCGTSRGPNTNEPAGATTVRPATQIVSIDIVALAPAN